MSELYKNKYRSKTARAEWWDYSRTGAYFITICTKDRIHYFGDVVDGKMVLSEMGKIAEQMWIEIPNHHQNIELSEFVVMPNHVHGIIIINNTDEIANSSVQTGHALSPQEPGKNRFQNIGKNSISAIIGSYKSAVTKHANKLGLPNGWQTRFHDHIIRDAGAFDRISEYIINNPEKWHLDTFQKST